MNVYRQGDVMLVERDSLPDASYPVERQRHNRSHGVRGKGEGIILAAGEVTGHHHRIKDRNAKLFHRGDDAWIKTSKNGAVVTHEEHDPIELPANTILEVVRQKEYVPPVPGDAPNVSRSTYVYD